MIYDFPDERLASYRGLLAATLKMPDIPPMEAKNIALDSLVQIHLQNPVNGKSYGHATGILLTNDGFIASACHVIEDVRGEWAQVTDRFDEVGLDNKHQIEWFWRHGHVVYRGQKYPLDLHIGHGTQLPPKEYTLRTRGMYDTLLLKAIIPGRPGPTGVRIAPTIRMNEDVTLVGYSGGQLHMIPSRVTLINLGEFHEPVKEVGFDSEIFDGMSGGFAINDKGQLVALFSRSFDLKKTPNAPRNFISYGFSTGRMIDMANVWANILLWGFENGYPLPYNERGPSQVEPYYMDLGKLTERFEADGYDVTRHLPGNY